MCSENDTKYNYYYTTKIYTNLQVRISKTEGKYLLKLSYTCKSHATKYLNL